jgi:hypothetical protein
MNTHVGSNGCFIATSRYDNISRAAISCGTLPEPWTGESMVNSTEYNDSILHHMISTISDSTISFYIDGNFIGSSVLSESNKIKNLSNNYAFLAQSGYVGFDSTWVGSIYKFSLYNKALVSDEVLYLYQHGAESTPTLISSETYLSFDELNPTGSFTVYGLNLSDSIHVITPAGFTVSTKVLPGNANLTSVAVIYDGVSSSNGYITLQSGTITNRIRIKGIKNSDCFIPLYSDRTNLITDPYLNSLSTFGGWTSNGGTSSINRDTSYVYCGIRSGKISATAQCNGSVDQVLTGTMKPNTIYRLRAMVYAVDGPFQIGVYGWSGSLADSTKSILTTGSWQPVDFTFTTGNTLGATQGLFFNSCLAGGGTTGYIDNWEAYEIASVTTSIPNRVDLQNLHIPEHTHPL